MEYIPTLFSRMPTSLLKEIRTHCELQYDSLPVEIYDERNDYWSWLELIYDELNKRNDK